MSLLASLLSSINSKAVAKRALFSSIPFEIGPDFKISVKGYIIFKRQVPHRSCYIWLEGEKPQIAMGSSTQIADDSARPVEKVEVRKAYKFGGEQITFAPEEVSDLRNFGDPGIRIIGFKPLSLLPIWANLKPSTFIYPSEEDFVGSTRVFSALQQKLLKDEKMAVAWFIARKNAAPVIAAVLPGAEKLDNSGLQSIPPGMWLCPLPFADDIRQNPEVTNVIRAPDPLVDRMRSVVEQLQLPKAQYDPSKYPNPALQWHYRILQAMALEEDLPEKPEDKTIPRYRQIDKRAGGYATDWGHELHSQHEAWRKDNETSSAIPAKRATSDGRTEMAVRDTKRSKTGDADAAPDDTMMKIAFDNQSITMVCHQSDFTPYEPLRASTDCISLQMTVPQLKAWLQAKGIIVSGKKKNDLVESVEEYWEKK